MDVAIAGGLVLLLFVLIALGVQIGVTLILVGALGLLLLRGVDVSLAQLEQVQFSSTAVFAFSIIPLFILMGEAALRSGMTTRLFNAFNVWLGRLPGGLGAATVSTSAMFAAISGSSVATTLMLSRVTIPEMRRAGYADRYSATVLAAGGSFAVLIPPSAMLVLYALLTEQSIGRALIAGVGPGILTVVLYLTLVIGWAMVRPEVAPTRPPSNWREKRHTLTEVLPVAAIALLVVGGIYTGFLTPTESAAAGAFAVMALGAVRRHLKGRDHFEAAKRSTIATAQVFIILIGAMLFGRFISLAGVGPWVVDRIEDSGISGVAVMLVIVCIYLVMGTFLEGMSALVITVPILAPVIQGLGYDLLWFGVVVVKLIEISVVTPPLGLNVLVLSSAVPDLSINEVWARIWIFVALDLFIIVLLFLFPEIVTWLPSRM